MLSLFVFWGTMLIWFSFHLFGCPSKALLLVPPHLHNLQMLECSSAQSLYRFFSCMCTYPSSSLMYLLLTLKCISVAWTFFLNSGLECPTTFFSSSLERLTISNLTFSNLEFCYPLPFIHPPTHINLLFQSSQLSLGSLFLQFLAWNLE